MLIVLTALSPIIMPKIIRTYAANTDIKFDYTNVLDDLKSSTINGKPFNILDYPPSEFKKASVINFVEYCYSYKVNQRANYGLYVYVYNPQTLNFNTKTLSNKIQISTTQNGESNGIDYEKYSLQFCSMSTEPNYYRLFYKFKVIDRKSADGKTMLERINSSERRYNVSGIELFETDKNNAVDYPVNSIYRFSGYAKGYGLDANAETNLDVDAKELETISLDVEGTYYRTGLSNKGVDHQNQLDSVYFSVDNSILEKYGKLQKVKAEWYEYKTKPIVVSSLAEYYNVATKYIGQTVEPFNSEFNYALFYNKWYGSSSSTINRFDWAFNPTDMGAQEVSHKNIDKVLYYLFLTDNIQAYDPYGAKKAIGGVSSNDLYEYIKNYKTSFNNGMLPIKDNTISADLFEDGVDENRLKGINTQEIDEADIDITKMLSYNSSSPDFWQKSKDFGFWKTLFNDLPENLDESIIGLPPIYPIKDEDLNGTDVEISKRLAVRSADIGSFKEYRRKAKESNQTTFLFRFAVTDYFSGALEIHREANTWHGFDLKKWTDKAYMARETVFLDFDIIQLTFNKDGLYHVIPVVSNPIDKVGDITPPIFMPEKNNWWKLILMVLVLILLLWLLAPVMPQIISFFAFLVKGLFNILFFPFKAISKAMKKNKLNKVKKE